VKKFPAVFMANHIPPGTPRVPRYILHALRNSGQQAAWHPKQSRNHWRIRQTQRPKSDVL